MKLVLNIVGFLWLLPATALIWLFYVLPVWAMGYIKLVGTEWPAAKFKLVAHNNLYSNLWRKWWGWSGPCVYVYKDVDYIISNDGVNEMHRKWLTKQVAKTEVHEIRHCWQQLIFGPLHYPLYGLCFVVLTICNIVFRMDVHGYYDNPFERDARRAAGQQVDIPRSQWSSGPNDTNPWI